MPNKIRKEGWVLVMVMPTRNMIALVALFVMATQSRGDTYRGIGPLDSYAMVKAKLPGADFTELHPVWLGKGEWFYGVTGYGLPGEIMIKTARRFRVSIHKKLAAFYSREADSLRQAAASLSRELAEQPWSSSSLPGFADSLSGVSSPVAPVESTFTAPAETTSVFWDSPEALEERAVASQELANMHRNWIEREPLIAQDSARVEWVRWVPSTPIPVKNLIAKYGEKWIKGYSDEDMLPYYRWPARGILAKLDNDGRAVVLVDYTFTQKDFDEAYRVELPRRLVAPGRARPTVAPRNGRASGSQRKASQR